MSDKPMTPQEMQKKSAEVFMQRYGREGYAKAGKASAEKRLTIGHDREYYAELGRRSAAKRKAQKQAKFEAEKKAESPLTRLGKLFGGR